MDPFPLAAAIKIVFSKAFPMPSDAPKFLWRGYMATLCGAVEKWVIQRIWTAAVKIRLSMNIH